MACLFRARLRRLLSAMLAVTACCSAIFAQNPNDTGNIIGQVRIGGGSLPPERLLVNLTTRGLPFASSYTDDEGRFGFYNLPANPYHLTINESGYSPVDIIVAVNPAVIRTNMVQVNLTARQKVSETRTPPAGSNPYLVDPAEYNKRYPSKATKEFEK